MHRSQSSRLCIRAVMGAVAWLTAACTRAEVTLESLLGEMLDCAAVARWPQPEFTCKQASRLA